MVLENTDVDICDAFEHIKAWAVVNKLTLNLQKTKEIVFRRPRVSHFHMPSAVNDIEQLNCVKLLGVLFQDNLRMNSHVHFLKSQCSQCTEALEAAAASDNLRVVAYSLIVSCIVYALPVWGGFMSAELIGKVDAMFRHLKRFGYISYNLNFSDLIQNADEDLFHKMQRP